MHQLPIIARKEVAENTLEVTFDVRGKTCLFRPGQYLTVMLPELKFPDPKGNSRVFSIASSPDNKESISIVFRLSGSGFKQTLNELPMGSLVTADCCWGNFTLPEDSSTPLVFVAGGVGVAPFMSSVRFVVEEKLPHRITLIYANKDKASAMYLAELEDIAAHNKNVTLKTVFGAVDRAILDECVQQQKDAKWFVAGPAVMVNTVQASLHELGVPSIRIHSEEFAGYVDLGGEKAYDSRTELVEQSLLGISDGALKGIITALNDAILISVTDVSGTITYANDMFVRVSKYPREELIGQNHRLLKSGKHSPEFYAELWRTVSSGKIWRGEVKNRAKDGTFYWVDATIAPIVDEKGMVNGYLAARIPIDKKKELEDRNRMFSNIIQETSQPWGMSDLEGKFVEVNHAFIDFLGYSFDELKQKTNIHNIPVMGRIVDLPKIKKREGINGIIIAIPSAEAGQIKQITELAQKNGINYIKILPSLAEFINDRISLRDIRDINVEDLLGRKKIDISFNEIKKLVAGQRVLITGAAGSIGFELVKQICKFSPEHIIALDMDETGIFRVENYLAGTSLSYQAHVINILNKNKLDTILNREKPSLIFHAAAYKHVKLMETHPDEAIINNILGTWNLAQSAHKNQVKKFIFISTERRNYVKAKPFHNTPTNNVVKSSNGKVKSFLYYWFYRR